MVQPISRRPSLKLSWPTHKRAAPER
jgi:hypothetical protein